MSASKAFSALLTGEAFFVFVLFLGLRRDLIERQDFEHLARHERDDFRLFRTLDRERAAVIEALHAMLPGHHVEAVQVALVYVRRQEEVHGLCLIDHRSTVARMFDDPALVEFEGGLEDILFLVAQEIEMLDGTARGDDGGPGIVVIAALLLKKLRQVTVADIEGARQRLVREGVRRDGLDARRRTAGDDSSPRAVPSSISIS